MLLIIINRLKIKPVFKDLVFGRNCSNGFFQTRKGRAPKKNYYKFNFPVLRWVGSWQGLKAGDLQDTA